jgi:hypothetical protein
MSTEPVARPCPSELTLERLRQGELAVAEAQPLESHARDCLACRRRLEELQAPPPALPAPLPVRRPFSAPLAAGLGALAAAGLSLWLRPAPDTQTKGPPWSLQVIARGQDGRVTRVDPGAPLAPGDRLRFEVSTSWPEGHVALVSFDGAGQVSALVAESSTVAVRGGQRTLLPGAVELDASRGPERILLVGCGRPRSLDDVMASARRALERAGGDPRRVGALDLGCHEEAFWINKVPR